MYKTENICLCKMTNAHMQSFFKEFTYDPNTFKDESQCRKYIYNEQNVDAYYRENILQGKLHFAVMLDDTVIGDAYLKQIDQNRKCCSFGIHLINDTVKNKGLRDKDRETAFTICVQ